MELCTDSFLYNKIVIACANNLAYIVALVDPLANISAFINRLTLNVIVFKA